MKTYQRESGVSLIEALVALAIMAFGMLGVIGMQATLRFNADVSKQRSEAVRLAQEEIERLRNFSLLATTPGSVAFDDIASVAAATVALPASANATYTRTTTVAPAVAGDPLLKKVTVSVSWLDRRAASSSDSQAVTLTTVVAGIAPELAGSLGIPGDQAATQRPRERHSAIPVGATNQGTTSTFSPPGGGSLVWVFNNATGMITSTCTPTLGCAPFNAWLLTGFVQFAVSGAPTALIAESPSDAPLPGVGVSVIQTVPISQTVSCRTSPSSTSVTYYCAVQTFGTNPWSGRSELTGISLATSLTDASASLYKVCRYTSVQSPTTPGNNNAEHPLNYAVVASPLTNQNFLVTLSGDGTNPYPCPGDVPGNLVNSTTFQHQPST